MVDESNQTKMLAQKAQLLNQLELMKKPVVLDLTVEKSPSALKSVIKLLPKSVDFLGVLNKTGSSVLKVADQLKIVSNATASDVFGWAGLGFTIWNFVRIPFMYLLSFLMNEKAPVKLSNHLKFLYSGIVLALAIVALTVPGAAPIIGFVLGSVGLALSVFALGKAIYKGFALRGALKEVQQNVLNEEQTLLELKKQALTLTGRLRDAPEAEVSEIAEEVSHLEGRYHEQIKKLEVLKTLERDLKKKIESKDILYMAQKSLGVVLSMTALVGLVVGIYFPPIGAGILLGAAFVGLSVGFITLVGPPLVSAIIWSLGKNKPAVSSQSEQVVAGNTNTHHFDPKSGDSVEQALRSDKVSGVDKEQETHFPPLFQPADTGKSHAETNEAPLQMDTPKQS